MGLGFLDRCGLFRTIGFLGMVTYPLDDVLLATLVGVVCGADDWEGGRGDRQGGARLAARLSAV